jgi:hypothetical protein
MPRQPILDWVPAIRSNALYGASILAYGVDKRTLGTTLPLLLGNEIYDYRKRPVPGPVAPAHRVAYTTVPIHPRESDAWNVVRPGGRRVREVWARSKRNRYRY